MPGRVALVVPAFPRVSETFIVSKFTGLLRRGWDIHVVCERSEAKDWLRFPQLDEDRGIRQRVHVGSPHRPRLRAVVMLPLVLLHVLLVAPGRTLRYLRRGCGRLGLSETLKRLYLDAALIRLGPDIVHFEFGALAPRRMDLKELLDCRIVVSFRGYDVNFVGLDQPGHYDPVWAGADGLHFLGEDLWRRARRRGCPPEIFHVLIPPAIDPEYFQPDPRPPAEPEEASRPLRILSVGRLEWKKGYEDALQAVRKLIDAGVPCEYRILGDGESMGSIAYIRRRLDLESAVELLGVRPREDVKREMRRADVLLHAAVSEGFSNAVIEAQAMEVPVVCTDADGLAENVEDGRTGFVAPRRNPQALAEKLGVLARDPALRRAMGLEGRRRVLAKFRLEDQLDRFERFYGEVLGGEPSLHRRERAGVGMIPTDPDVARQ